MAFMMMLPMNNIVSAMDDPVNNKLMEKVKNYFDKQERTAGSGGFKEVYYPGDEITSLDFSKGAVNYFEKIKFILSNGIEITPSGIVSPNLKDRRLIKFYNMQAFLSANKGTQYGGNLTLKVLLDAYMEARANATEFLEKISKNSKIFNKELEKFEKKIEMDPKFKSKVQDIADKTGVPYDVARHGVIQAATCDAVLERKGRELDEIVRNINNLNNEISSLKSSLSEADSKMGNYENEIKSLEVKHKKEAKGLVAGRGVGGGVLGGVAAFGGPIGWAIFTGIGFGISYFSSKSLAESHNEEMKEIEDKKQKLNTKIEDLQKQKDVAEYKLLENEDDKAKAKAELIDNFKAERLLEQKINFGILIRNIVHFMVREPGKVRDSNLFIMAMDYRNFYNERELKEKDHNEILALNEKTKNQEAWCDFRYVPSLKNAPRANEVEIESKKPIENIIDIFQIVCKNDGKNVDYDKLRKYMNGDVIPLALNPDITGTIEGFLKNNLPDETIVTVIMSMPNLKLKADPAVRSELLQLVKEQREVLSASGKAEEEEKKEKKFLPQLPAAK